MRRDYAEGKTRTQRGSDLTVRRRKGGYRGMGSQDDARLHAQQATGAQKYWHELTGTTTMTPVGFPLSRYSHRAPREGRSLSTAAPQSLPDREGSAVII